MKEIIAVGTDHAGVALKDRIVAHLEKKGVEAIDYGVNSSDSCDYPDIAIPLCEKVAQGIFHRGILVCGTGIGMSIAANKVEGVRAALCVSTDAARLSREHNNANVLVVAGRDATAADPIALVDAWLTTAFSGEVRHARRLDKISAYERSGGCGSDDCGGCCDA